MNKLKRLAALVLAACMIFSLCACGDESGSSDHDRDDDFEIHTRDPEDSGHRDEDEPAGPTDSGTDDPSTGPTDSGADEPEPEPEPEPEEPTNSDGAKCHVCGGYLTDFFPLNEGCGVEIFYQRNCPNGCGVVVERTEFNWHNIVDGVCTDCGATESDPTKLKFELNEDGTGYILTLVTSDHHDKDLIVPREYNGLPVVGVGPLKVVRQDSIQPYFIYLPETVTELPEGAFKGLKRIVAVWLPDSVTEVSAEAFKGCSALMYLRFGTELETVGEYAFNACTELRSVSLPDSVKELGAAAFMGCTILSEVDLGAGLQTVGEAAFAHCSALIQMELPESVTTLMPTVFSRCENLQSVNIPPAVTFIPNDCFYECKALSQVKWHDGIEFIDSYAFAKTSITELPLLPNLRGVAGGAFKDCYSLVKVTLPEGFVTIHGSCFENCRSLTELNLPDSLMRIEEDAFKNCGALSPDAIPTLPTQVGFNSDGYCCTNGHLMTDWEHSAGRIMTCHDAITYTRFCPVCGETAVKSETKWHNLAQGCCIDCGVTETPEEYLQFRLNDAGTGYIFTGALDTIIGDVLIIPRTYQGLPVVEVEAFGGPTDSAYKLRVVYVPEGVTKIHPDAAKGTNLYLLYLPDSLEEIPANLCGGGRSQYLAALRLGSGLKTIGAYAFSSTSLIWVELPAGVESVGEQAFVRCDELTGILIPEGAVLGEGVFGGTPLENKYPD